MKIPKTIFVAINNHRGSSVMRFLFLFVFTIVASASTFATVEVSEVTAKQRSPWGIVDVSVKLAGPSYELDNIGCLFWAVDNDTQEPISLAHFTMTRTNVLSNTTRSFNYLWRANDDVGDIKIDDVALHVDLGVQLWEDGPYWAECNVGASSPEGYGYYFWWGDTIGYTNSGTAWVSLDGKNSTFPFSTENYTIETYRMSIDDLLLNGYIDSTTNLVARHDAATTHLGAPWRMPTYAEINAMIKKCTSEWISTNGVCGCLVRGNTPGYTNRCIFLPAAGYAYGSTISDLRSKGYYSSSTPANNCGVWYLKAHSKLQQGCGIFDRNQGRPVRPVRGCAK